MASKKKYQDIDELFRSRLENITAIPGAAVRDDLMKKVSFREFFRFNPASFNVYYLAVAAVSIAAVLVIFFSDMPYQSSGGGEADNTVIAPGNRYIPVFSDSAAYHTGDTAAVATESRDYRKGGPLSGKTSGRQAVKGVADMPVRNSSDPVPAGLQPVREVKISMGDSLTLVPGNPVSSFTISPQAGCGPLNVRLHSTSVNYSKLTWHSGDGRSSENADIEWVFNKPGGYTIILTASDNEGRSHQSSAEVTVYPRPHARFDVMPGHPGDNDREIILYNYSTEFLTSRWDFGDGVSSLLNEPSHKYSSGGSYRIVLSVSNEFGCTDSVSVKHVVSSGSFDIVFPNAFMPNKNGPTGGYYSSRSDEAAFVFHPEYEGVSDYHLTIYSRTGMLLFESHNLNIGWDGYFKGRLCEPGVYIWRARGRYANGEQFLKSGDVTLLKF